MHTVLNIIRLPDTHKQVRGFARSIVGVPKPKTFQKPDDTKCDAKITKKVCIRSDCVKPSWEFRGLGTSMYCKDCLQTRWEEEDAYMSS